MHSKEFGAGFWLLALLTVFVFIGDAPIRAAEQPAYARLKPEIKAAIEKMEGGTIHAKVKIPWRLFVPATASNSQRLPMVVFLHGAGMRGEDNIGPMSLAWPFASPEGQAKHPCFVFAPQVRLGRRWVNQAFTKGAYSSDAIPITDEMSAVLRHVEKLLTERPIDARRVYVVGQSMGGYGTWDALVRKPDLWAAAVPICGGGDPSKADLIKAIPVWAWHGDSDTNVPVSGSRDMIAALTKAGATPLYTEIPKGGHGVWNIALADPKMFEWLFAQKRH